MSSLLNERLKNEAGEVEWNQFGRMEVLRSFGYPKTLRLTLVRAMTFFKYDNRLPIARLFTFRCIKYCTTVRMLCRFFHGFLRTNDQKHQPSLGKFWPPILARVLRNLPTRRTREGDELASDHKQCVAACVLPILTISCNASIFPGRCTQFCWNSE